MPESLNYMSKSADKLVTSEYQKEWTEKNPNSKLKEINDSLESIRKETPEIKKLKNLIESRDYREFQKVIGVTPYDGKLGINSLRYFGIYKDKILKTDSVISHINGFLSNVGPAQNTGAIENIVDTVRIARHEEEYLSSHETMSETQYNNLFSGKEQIQQGQGFGDCYLISSIIELSNAQHFDTLMRTSIFRYDWPNGDLGYWVKIPLGEPSGRKIFIKDSEIDVARMNGNTGFKLLEVAYAKYKLQPNLKKNERKEITSSEFNKIQGGSLSHPLQTFIGMQNIGFNDFGTKGNYDAYKMLKQCSPSIKSQIEGYLKNYNTHIGNKFMMLGSKKNKTDHETYKVGDKILHCNHAYSITNVKKDSQGDIINITVLNPWNAPGDGNNYLNFTLEEFYEAFSEISEGTIKTKDFLDNKSFIPG